MSNPQQPFSSSKEEGEVVNDLPTKALNILLSNQVTEIISSKRFTYISPHSNTTQLQESSSTLLAARALAKAGHSKQAWEIIESLFAAQGANGFLPRYRYAAVHHPNHNTIQEEKKEQHTKVKNYIENSTFPNYPLFQSAPPHSYAPPTLSSVTELHGSGRIAAPPFHASILLDVFYLSPKSANDLNQLGYFFHKLYKYHDFYHTILTRGCGVDGAETSSGADAYTEVEESSSAATKSATPCYNALHPWETELELNSPLWSTSLQPVLQHMNRTNWTLDGDDVIPEEVKQAHDFPKKEEIYHAMLYLLECQSNMTVAAMKESAREKEEIESTTELTSLSPTDAFSIQYEESLLSSCHPHALQDVSIASALSKSDTDLNQIAKILYDENYKNNNKEENYGKITKEKWSNMKLWKERSRNMLNGLWDERAGAFLSKSAVLDWHDVDLEKDKRNHTKIETEKKVEKDDLILFNESVSVEDDAKTKEHGYFTWNRTYHTLTTPVGDAFLGAWGMNDLDDENEFNVNDRIGSMSFRLLEPFGDGKQKEGSSFRCGLYPIASVGGDCTPTDNADDDDSWEKEHPVVVVSPTRNYWSARGFQENGAIGVGRYLVDSTLHMMCGLSNAEDGFDSSNEDFVNCIAGTGFDDGVEGAVFGDAYNVNTGKILPNGITTWTKTAAIAYDLSIPDKQFYYTPAPPLSNSWVIVLIAVELAVAFGIGVSCIVMSWSLMRRLKENNDSDAFVRTARYQRYTAMDLYGGDEFETVQRQKDDGAGVNGGGGLDGLDGPLQDGGDGYIEQRPSRHNLMLEDGAMTEQEERALDSLMSHHRGGSTLGGEESVPSSSSQSSSVMGSLQEVISNVNPFKFGRFK
mmetsp:Transcript_52815/g.78711  ORF Transcript_52815/g.78711 Transcript_52815/m.78711 type:complete len:863 (+) Transcript_52815:175-2763(+)